MIDVLSNKISGCVIWFYFTMFFVNIGKNPGNKVLSAVELTPGILRAAMQALLKINRRKMYGCTSFRCIDFYGKRFGNSNSIDGIKE